jgi:hypothetical protein
MFGSQILDVVIGIVFMFLIVSIICSSIREGLESVIKARGAFLEYGIRELLHDKDAKDIAKTFFNHPLIYGLFSGGYTTGSSAKPNAVTRGRDLPSYIPAKNFALALMDIAARGSKTNLSSSDGASPAISSESIRLNISNIENKSVQRVLLTAVDAAQGDINKLQTHLEDWYNSGMDRVSGWYKRSTSWMIFWIALVVVIAGNVNTLAIANYLATNDSARLQVVEDAGKAVGDTNFTAATTRQAATKLSSVGWPVGWGKERTVIKAEKGDTGAWKRFGFPVLGWLLTAIAATMGAPFWFDLLNKLMVIRSTVKPHEKSPEEASEDRQHPTQKNQVPVQAQQQAMAAAGQAPVVAPAVNTLLPTPLDKESEEDGCHGTHDITQFTNDDELPPAQGGVA